MLLIREAIWLVSVGTRLSNNWNVMVPVSMTPLTLVKLTEIWMLRLAVCPVASWVVSEGISVADRSVASGVAALTL